MSPLADARLIYLNNKKTSENIFVFFFCLLIIRGHYTLNSIAFISLINCVYLYSKKFKSVSLLVYISQHCIVYTLTAFINLLYRGKGFTYARKTAVSVKVLILIKFSIQYLLINFYSYTNFLLKISYLTIWRHKHSSVSIRRLVCLHVDQIIIIWRNKKQVSCVRNLFFYYNLKVKFQTGTHYY